MKMFRRSEGFTLVELMVVVLIIGILVAIAIPVFAAARTNAQKKTCWANQRTIEGQANAYYAEFDAFPADVAALVTGKYLQKAPACPTQGAAAYVLSTTDGTVGNCTDHGHF